MVKIDIEELAKRIRQRADAIANWSWSPDNPISKLKYEDPNVFEDLLAAYEEGSPEQRHQIRRMIADMGAGSSLMLGAIPGEIKQLENTGDPKWLREALLEFSILDSQEDPRDLNMILAELYLTAARAGIDPQPYFEEIAAISGSEPRDEWGTNTKNFLANFHNYAFFAENVRPELEKLSDKPSS